MPALEIVLESPREKSGPSMTAQAAEGMLDIASLFAADVRALGAALTPRGMAAAPKPPASPAPPAAPPPPDGAPPPPDGAPPPPDGAPPPPSTEEQEGHEGQEWLLDPGSAPTAPLDPNRRVWGPKGGAGRRGGVALTADGRVVQAHGLSELHTAELHRATRRARLQVKIKQTKRMLQRVYRRAFDREPAVQKSDSSTGLATKGKATHVPKLKVGDDHV